MKQFVLRNNLNLLAALGIGVAIYLSVNWAVMPVLQRSVGLFSVALVLRSTRGDRIVRPESLKIQR